MHDNILKKLLLHNIMSEGKYLLSTDTGRDGKFYAQKSANFREVAPLQARNSVAREFSGNSLMCKIDTDTTDFDSAGTASQFISAHIIRNHAS